MLFNSLEFAFFLPVVLCLYWLLPSDNKNYRNALLLIASYVFYGWWDWRFLGLIAFVISPTYTAEDIRDNESMATMLGVINKENLPLFDFRGDPAFVNNHELFFDRSHLNHSGALLLSEKVANRLLENKEFDSITTHLQ